MEAGDRPLNPNWIAPPGTQVVTLPPKPGSAARPDVVVGSVGVIVVAPLDPRQSYRVRFLDGLEASFARDEFELLKRVQFGPPQAASPVFSLADSLIYRCIVGSRAYGLDHEGSDTDRRGIYLPPAELHWSLWGVPEQVEDHDTQECYWEYQKFIILALKANPNILECLFTPLVELVTPAAQELRSRRSAFVSRLIYQTYNGYVLSQFRKLSQDQRAVGKPRWKHAMHLVRLLLSGITALRTGEIPLAVDAHRERLLAIRRGELSWEQVDRWRLELQQEFEGAYAVTSLPERPDYTVANRLLLDARRSRT